MAWYCRQWGLVRLVLTSATIFNRRGTTSCLHCSAATWAALGKRRLTGLKRNKRQLFVYKCDLYSSYFSIRGDRNWGHTVPSSVYSYSTHYILKQVHWGKYSLIVNGVRKRNNKNGTTCGCYILWWLCVWALSCWWKVTNWNCPEEPPNLEVRPSWSLAAWPRQARISVSHDIQALWEATKENLRFVSGITFTGNRNGENVFN